MKNLVKSMFMSILTAGIFAFSFSSCSDNMNDEVANDQPTPQGAKAELLESYGLTFKSFDKSDDVVILNADTTLLSISKAYAEKMGITSFVNHPMGIWHRVENLPYIRKATAEKIAGDRYIVTVVPTTIAEVLGNKKIELKSEIFVNKDANAVKTRAAGDNIPEYAAKYIDNDNVIHPAYIHMTDPYGYEKDAHYNGEQPSAAQTRAAQSGEYQYITADEMASGNTRWGCHNRIISFKDKLEHSFDFPLGKDSKDTVSVNVSSEIQFGLNYFITLDGGIKWDWCLPKPYLKMFEAGIDGNFSFNAELSLGWEKEWKLDPNKWREKLFTFKGYTFTFFVGPIPVAITTDPHLDVALDGSVSGGVEMGFSYEYANTFKGGFGWADGKGFYGITGFKEEKNEFDMNPLCIKLSAKAGVGLYLACDLKLYGLAGPKLGVGPRLGGELEAELSPYKMEASFKAKVALGFNAVIGAKVEVLGYKIADKNLTFQLAGPWVLWKYNWELEDGEEIHKSPEAMKNDTIRLMYQQIVDQMCEQWAGAKTNYEEVVNMLMILKGYTRQQAEDVIFKGLLKLYPSFETTESMVNKMSVLNQYILKYGRELYPQYETAMTDKKWQEVAEAIKQCPAYEQYVNYVTRNFNLTLDLNLLRKNFVQENGREPVVNKADLDKMIRSMVLYGVVYYKNSPAAQQKYGKAFVNRFISYGKSLNTHNDQMVEDAAYTTIMMLYKDRHTDYNNYNWNTSKGDWLRRIYTNVLSRLSDELQKSSNR